MTNKRTPLSPSEFKQLIGKYAAREFSRKSILSIRDGAGVIEKLLGGGKYRRILEIGTYRGVSSAYMSQFVDSVHTIDLKLGKMEQDAQVFDRVRFWQALGITNCTLHLVESDAEKAEVVRGMVDFDFAFIDGNHDGNAPKLDFELVKRCGAVLFHDCDGDNGVTKLIKTLPPNEVQMMDIFAFWRAPNRKI